MREVLTELMQWWSAGETVGVGTVVGTWRSAPRQPGASMLVGPGGEAVGSVSGGCVEGAVYELAQEVVESGEPVLQRYGVSDDEAYAVGLTCGGILDVYVEKVSKETFPELGLVASEIEAGRPVAVVTVIEHPDPSWLGRRLILHPEDEPAATTAHPEDERAATPAHPQDDRAAIPEPSPAAYAARPTVERPAPAASDESRGQEPSGHVGVIGTLGSARADEAVIDDARGLLAAGRTGILTYGPDGERRGEGMRVFVASYAPKPRMLVFGAIDFAAAVARVGSFLGYHVTVCDARPVFATATRFPGADEVVVKWPHDYLQAELDAGRIDARTVICVLTHDPKFDVPLLKVALRMPEFAYLGAMGSRRTHENRLERLREAGLLEEELRRMSSPIGLDLGARTPEETAISIAAEIIALRWGGGGDRLAHTRGPIHHHHPAHDTEPSPTSAS